MTAPYDPPIPVPDVPGADAGARGLPSRSELTAAQRAIVDASVVADIGLRTAIASLVGAAMLPPVLTGIFRGRDLHRERTNLAFYADLASERNADRSFPAPTVPPRVATRPADPLATWIAKGSVEHISFSSSFRPVNPGMRGLWRRLERNNTVHAQHWRHDDGPRPTLCVIHGFLGSAYLFNGLFFSLPWFFRSGYDILLYTLPFHGRRAEKYSPFSGYGIFAYGMAGFAEAMGQAIHDFRSVLDYLEHTGVRRMALTGLSLGGYTSALIASADHRLQAVIPNVPVVQPEALFDEWFPANKLVKVGRMAGGISAEESAAASAYHSPLNYTPRVPKDRRLIITGLGDRLAPPEQAVALWEHWDRCALHWFPGNHILHVSQPEYLRRMTRFLRPVMF
ncbi:alpha/beta hydrolase family protein [Mycolicibacterium palauense]|uniref:alpha/beta hydrolase family protein n=1 Tax=Mycolicibacterium palauense TaxID=2034511 RepID=UPI000BFF10D8|nr:alpha/beta fold hydrolase [Mycolicibacterium palauense]